MASTGPVSCLPDFVEDLIDLATTAGYRHKEDYAWRMGLTLVAFNQRVCRARKEGLLPSRRKDGCKEFRPIDSIPCYCNFW